MNIEPCMWCNADEKDISIMSSFSSDEHRVFCFKCKCAGPIRDSSTKAIDAWNEVARIVLEAKETKYIKPSYAVSEAFSYKGIPYEVIKTIDKDSYFIKVDDYLYDKEYESFGDAYERLKKLIDILIADKEKDNA